MHSLMLTRRRFLSIFCLLPGWSWTALAQRRRQTPPVLGRTHAAQRLFARLLQLEDERYYSEEEFIDLLSSPNARVRRRACLALGRIGDARAYRFLLERLYDDDNPQVRAMAAFAIGELESTEPIEDLRQTLRRRTETDAVRGRCAEAIGKIVAANTQTLDADTVQTLLADVLDSLPPPTETIPAGSEAEALAALCLTAAMRMRQAQSAPALLKQLSSHNGAIRFHAANALARLSDLPEVGQALVRERENLRRYFQGERQDVVRVALARVLGALGDAETTDVLLGALDAKGVVVQIAVLRALALTRVPEVVIPKLITVLEQALVQYADVPAAERPTWPGLLPMLTLVETLGRLKAVAAQPLLERLRLLPTGYVGANPEVEVALARLGADAFFGLDTAPRLPPTDNWWAQSNYFAGLSILPADDERRARVLEMFLAQPDLDARARKALLDAVPRTSEQAQFWISELLHPDVMVRATAATALAALPPSAVTRTALATAFQAAQNDPQNDARLAMLNALATDPHPETQTVFEAALRDKDWLVRKRAGDILLRRLPNTLDEKARAAQITALRQRVGICRVPHREAFYGRLIRQHARHPRAVVLTTKGELTLELFSEDAPLTVENFLKLAERGFFNALTFHRVVPNFVVQGGDPRGDGDGGPGYQIRCEINLRPFVRGSVGMALSGKDTGGSQWFICHLPQPHLDGGYTCFGQVVNGLETLDRLVRRDQIVEVRIV